MTEFVSEQEANEVENEQNDQRNILGGGMTLELSCRKRYQFHKHKGVKLSPLNSIVL